MDYKTRLNAILEHLKAGGSVMTVTAYREYCNDNGSEFHFTTQEFWQIIGVAILGFIVMGIGYYVSLRENITFFLPPIIVACGMIISLCSPVIVWWFAMCWTI